MNIIPSSPETTEPREERQTLTPEEWSLLEKTQVVEEDKSRLPRQLLLDPTKEFTPQKRGHLTPSIVKMTVPRKIQPSPLSPAIKLLNHLHDRDLQIISRGKSVSYVPARSAARLLFKRKGWK